MSQRKDAAKGSAEAARAEREGVFPSTHAALAERPIDAAK